MKKHEYGRQGVYRSEDEGYEGYEGYEGGEHDYANWAGEGYEEEDFSTLAFGSESYDEEEEEEEEGEDEGEDEGENGEDEM